MFQTQQQSHVWHVNFKRIKYFLSVQSQNLFMPLSVALMLTKSEAKLQYVSILCSGCMSIGPMSDGETRVSLSFISVFNHTYMVSFIRESSFVFYDFV